jgi:Mrp family chromosome partitioning ATPase
MRQLLDSVEPGFDWIIMDGPPVLESPDSASLATAADGVVMVVQAGRTKRPVLSRSVELLRKAGARVLGTVLNRRRLEIPGFIYRRI